MFGLIEKKLIQLEWYILSEIHRLLEIITDFHKRFYNVNQSVFFILICKARQDI